MRSAKQQEVSRQIDAAVKQAAANGHVGVIVLPPGCKFLPFEGGDVLSNGEVSTKAEQTASPDDEQHADGIVGTRVRADDAPREVGAWRHDLGLQRVVDPFTHADEKNSGGHGGSGRDREGPENSAATQQKHERADDHQHLVPVVERKFGQRVFHWANRMVRQHILHQRGFALPTFTTWLAALLLALILSTSHLLDSEPDRRAEWDQAADIQAGINAAIAEQRFAQAAQALCGPQAAWEQTPDGSVQCRTKHGRPTITVRVSP